MIDIKVQYESGGSEWGNTYMVKDLAIRESMRGIHLDFKNNKGGVASLNGLSAMEAKRIAYKLLDAATRVELEGSFKARRLEEVQRRKASNIL